MSIHTVINTPATLTATIARLFRDKYGNNYTALAKDLGWTVRRTEYLVKKESTSPWALLADCPRIGMLLGIRRERLLTDIIEALIPRHALIGRRLATAQGNRGIEVSAFAHNIGIPSTLLLRLYNGKIDTPPDKAIKLIGNYLKIGEHELHNIINESRLKRRYQTKDVGEVKDALPLAEILFDACEREKIIASQFAAKYRFAPNTIRQLIAGHQPDLTQDLIERLAQALDCALNYVVAGLKLNQSLPTGPHDGVIIRIESRVEGRPLRVVAKEIGIARSSLERLIALRDLDQANSSTMHAVRIWLGLSWEGLIMLAKQRERKLNTMRKSLTSAQPEEEQELQLLRHWRHAQPAARVQAMNALMGVDV